MIIKQLVNFKDSLEEITRWLISFLFKLYSSMRSSFIVILVSLTWIWIGCHSHEHDPVLEEAFEVHMNALEISDTISQKIADLEKDSTILSFQLKLDSIKNQHTTWQNQIVEVPGFEHDHMGEHHHHHHGENYLNDLPPEDMLEVQKEMKKQIEQLKEALESLPHL